MDGNRLARRWAIAAPYGRMVVGAMHSGRCGHRPLQKTCRAGPVCPAAEDAERVGRRHTWVPPYRDICKTCVGAAALPRPFSRFSSAQAGGVEPRPYAGQDDFRKNVIPRSAATWESVFPVWQGCGVGVLRFATPACGLVRNDMFFGRRGMLGAAGNDFQRLTFVLDSDRIGATNFAPWEVLV